MRKKQKKKLDFIKRNAEFVLQCFPPYPLLSLSFFFFFYFYLDFVPRLSLYTLRFFYHCSNTFLCVCLFVSSLDR